MNTCRILQRLVGLARIELATMEFHHPEPSAPNKSNIAYTLWPSALALPIPLPRSCLILFCRDLALGHSAVANYSLGIASLPRLIRLSVWHQPRSLSPVQVNQISFMHTLHKFCTRTPIGGWSEWRDLNSRPPHPKCGVLPTELHPDNRGRVIYPLTSHSSFAAPCKQILCPVLP